MMAIAYLSSLVNPSHVRRCRSNSGSIAVIPSSPVEEPSSTYLEKNPDQKETNPRSRLSAILFHALGVGNGGGELTGVRDRPLGRDFRGGSHGFNTASFGARHPSISTLPAMTRTRPSAIKRTVRG
jgi:hypothetical protein